MARNRRTPGYWKRFKVRKGMPLSDGERAYLGLAPQCAILPAATSRQQQRRVEILEAKARARRWEAWQDARERLRKARRAA